ncbi:hypothetical protein FRC98_15570 [Lujinxingia vulgaris]|uniref:Uncharacterized protein n=1 Tax=Lujinxingia vulgaris TaxID=2600176 RepID=A0A5C6XE30_9DELT|nr:hypothetical protein [Lujinxingia vulgaris]TXD35625.1 hypothetical protein FRC98_15570 [Lujinxingia vulgaris]
MKSLTPVALLASTLLCLTACSTPTPTDPPAPSETPSTPDPADLTLPTPQPPPPTTGPEEERFTPPPAPPEAPTTPEIPEVVDEPAPADAPTAEPHPTRCQTSKECVAVNLTRECCSACTDSAYHRDFVPHLRAHCDANPQLSSQCPALGCAFEPATAACIEGHCRAITTRSSIFGM